MFQVKRQSLGIKSLGIIGGRDWDRLALTVLMSRRKEVWLQLVLPAPIRARHWAHRLRCAAAIRALPSAVLGPVESPPWKRQRRLPGSILTRQAAPFRVRAPQRGRSLRRSGEPSPASPSSAGRLHLAPKPQAGSEQVRSRFAGHTIQPRRCQWFQFSLVTRGGGGLAGAASMAAWCAASLCRSFSKAQGTQRKRENWRSVTRTGGLADAISGLFGN
jgi:hypothetical protein